ncbi:MAG: Hsp70 family protein [bacterium]
MSVDNTHKPVLGIDLGTTYSCIARWDGRGPSVYQLAGGSQTLRSVVYYDKSHNDFLVGEIANKRGILDPDSAVFSVKRKMDNRNEKIVLDGKTFSPIDISQKILEKLLSDVTNKFPKGVFQEQGCVVTVPYYFKAHQCKNTEDAAVQANMNVLGILQEPIAAAMAYVIYLENEKLLTDRSEKFLVFDLGGGTFDVTVFEVNITENKILFEVLGTGGDDRLGGLDFDLAIMDYIIESENLKDDFIIPDKLKGDKRSKKEKEVKTAQQKLQEACKAAKEELGFVATAFIAIPQVFPGKDIDTELTLEKLNELLKPWLDKIDDIIESTLDTSRVPAQDIDKVIKVGGSSKLKLMSELLENKIGADKVYGDVDPSLCVAQGAAIYAALQDGRFEIEKEIEVLARTSHALGVEVADGDFHVIIPGNKKAPCEGYEIFGTDSDFVTELDIDVYQGSSDKVKDNSKVGTVHVSGLLARPAGDLDIKITFKVSDQQLISVIVEQQESNIYTVEKMQTA